MTPAEFPESNAKFHAPAELDENQCGSLPAYAGAVKGGSLDGAPIIVVAWRPSLDEILAINAGHPIFLSVLGSPLPPHMLTTSFQAATSPS